MTSPFKFLDSYTIADSKVFFGRDAEIDALYKLVFQTRLLLVYGQSGTGKTSIIQCGLANRFKDTDWFPVFVRRKDDINTAFDREIRRLAPTPIKAGAGIVKAINSLYLDCLRPITIIFDQFEELFILGSADEQALFFNNIKAILASDLNCKIIISMREEYIAQLQGFEKVVPSLFDKRLRIEQMTPANIEAVIAGTVAAAGITLEDGSATAQRIIDSINDRHTGVQLSYLQVYLDRLYRDAARTATPLLFTNALIEQAGALGDVMAAFLDEQSDAIEADLKSRHPDLAKDAIQQILEQMVTIDGTKLPIPRDQLAARLPTLAPVLNEALAALEASRIVRDVDGTYELAHDALARRIADRRSADRKAMLRIESLVKERLAASSETKTFLSREELALVRPAAGALQLSRAEADFVHQSDARLRRRRLLAIGGTAAIIAALAGFGTWARIEQKRAYAAIDLASATTNNLSFTIVETLRTIPKTQDIRRQLLFQVAKVNRQLGNGTGDNRNASFWQQILEGDIAFERMQDATTQPQQRALLAGARAKYRGAHALATSALAANSADDSWQHNVSVALGRQGTAEAYDDNDAVAARLYRQAVAIDTAMLKRDPADRDRQHDLQLSASQLGALEQQRGNIDAARQALRQAEMLAERVTRQDPANRDWRHDHAMTLTSLGDLDKATGEFDAARTHYGRAATLLDGLVKADASRLDWRRHLAIAWYNLVEIALETRQWGAARSQSDAAIAQAETLDEATRGDLSTILYRQRADLELSDGQPDRSRAAAIRSRDAARVLNDRNPQSQEYRRDLGLSHRQLGRTELGRCDYDSARKAAQDALSLAKALYEERGRETDYAFDLLYTHELVGEIEHGAGNLAAAKTATGNALRIAQELKRTLHDDEQLTDDLQRLQKRVDDLAKAAPAIRPATCTGSG